MRGAVCLPILLSTFLVLRNFFGAGQFLCQENQIYIVSALQIIQHCSGSILGYFKAILPCYYCPETNLPAIENKLELGLSFWQHSLPAVWIHRSISSLSLFIDLADNQMFWVICDVMSFNSHTHTQQHFELCL